MTHRHLIPLTLAALLLAGCGGTSATAVTKGTEGGGGGKGKGKGKKGDQAAPVLVSQVQQRIVPVEIRVIGSVEPYSTVLVKAQVGGELKMVHFGEGDFVKAGDLLFTIDPRTLEAQMRQIEANMARDEAALRQAEANLARDMSQEAHARSQAERYTQLNKEGVISRELYDNVHATARALVQTLVADRAGIESVKAQAAANRAAHEAQRILLSYTKIYAPIGGRTGVISIKPGNIVTPSVSELTAINQVQPLQVAFSVPEQNLAAIRRVGNQRLLVHATPEDGSGSQQSGALTFFDNSVDASTGTIKLKATFPNGDRMLWPGQFVRVVLEMERRAGALTIPAQAVQSSQDGTFVYVVRKNSTAEVRPVTVGSRFQDDVIIERGLDAGETVVTEGQLRIIPDGRVIVRQPGQRGPGVAAAAAGGDMGEGGERKGKKGKKKEEE